MVETVPLRPRAVSFPSSEFRDSERVPIAGSRSVSGLESWLAVIHEVLVLGIVEFGLTVEEEVVCFSLFWWGRDLGLGEVPVVVVPAGQVEDPGSGIGAGAGGLEGPGMAHNLGLHSGTPAGDPVRMTLLSHCENSFRIFLS